MRANYATAKSMTGESYGTGKEIGFNKQREAKNEVHLLEEMDQAWNEIIEIDWKLRSESLTESQISRLNKKREIKLSVVAKCESATGLKTA